METLSPQLAAAGQRASPGASDAPRPPRKHSLTKSFLTAKTFTSLGSGPVTPGTQGEKSLRGSSGRPDLERELSEDLGDVDKKEKKDLPQIQVALYRKYCQRHHVTPVGAFLRHPSAATLNLNNYNLGPDGAMALSVPLMIGTSLTHLNLEGNALGDEGMRHMQMCLEECPSLTRLNLNNNGIGRVGAEIISKVLLENKSLVAVSLGGNLFKDSDAVTFTQILTGSPSSAVKELSLSRNQLADGAAVLFGKALVDNISLEVLDLSWNHIRPSGGVALMNGLKDNVCLKKLLVSYNGMGNEGCRAAGTALTANRTLLELDLASNRITDPGLVSLAACIKQNDTLRVLKVGENVATGMGAQALGEAILEAEECNITLLDLTNINVFDSLVQKCKERAPSRVLTLRHGPIARYAVPREELEKRWVEEMMALRRQQEEEQAAAAAAAALAEGDSGTALPGDNDPSTGDDAGGSTPGPLSPLMPAGPDPGFAEGAPPGEATRTGHDSDEGGVERRPQTSPAIPNVSAGEADPDAGNADRSSRPTSLRSDQPHFSAQDESDASQSDGVQSISAVDVDNNDRSPSRRASAGARPISSGSTDHPNPVTAGDDQSEMESNELNADSESPTLEKELSIVDDAEQSDEGETEHAVS